MPEVPTPWIGLAALAAMVVLPQLPTWLREGRPRGVVCADCGAAWTDAHNCLPSGHDQRWSLHR
jgi:hypothetical protein